MKINQGLLVVILFPLEDVLKKHLNILSANCKSLKRCCDTDVEGRQTTAPYKFPTRVIKRWGIVQVILESSIERGI